MNIEKRRQFVTQKVLEFLSLDNIGSGEWLYNPQLDMIGSYYRLLESVGVDREVFRNRVCRVTHKEDNWPNQFDIEMGMDTEDHCPVDPMGLMDLINILIELMPDEEVPKDVEK